jgi:hypothetical protein
MPTPFNHQNMPPNHYYNDYKQNSGVVVRHDSAGNDPDTWTPPTYYVHPYTARLRPTAGNAPIRIRERHYDPHSHTIVREIVCSVEFNAAADRYIIERPAGTYISVQSGEQFDFEGDKDFG